MKKPELLSPAGNWAMLRTAVKNGTDAVYFGIDKFNMRATVKNFKLEELPEVVDFCHQNNVDCHLTLNTIIYEEELNELDNIIQQVKDAGIDLIICWDHSVIQKCVEYEMPFCVSTQASVSNSTAADFYKNLGAKRIVLARECTLEQIKQIKEKVDIEIETFVHGAMCVAISGRCFMSQYAYGRSANRGDCIQPCRREYRIIDKEGNAEFVVGEDFVLSPKDLNTIEFIDELIEAGIDSFKIEGRRRSPEYVAKVVSIYRKSIDLYFENKLDKEVKLKFSGELATVYNRGFSAGFYFGRPGTEDFATQRGSAATTKKVYVGKVINYFKKSHIAHIRLEAENLQIGDNIYITGNSTGLVELNLKEFVKDEIRIEKAGKGDDITFRCNELVRVNDKVYKIIKR